MKKIIFLLFVILFSCSVSDKEIIEKWENGEPKVILKWESKQDSIYTRMEYFQDGVLKSTKEFSNGKLHGKVIEYSTTGYKNQEFDYVNGKRNGIASAWYESGKIAFQFKYKEGLPYDGTEYFEDGWPRVLVKFAAPGIRDGKAFYFEEDGHIWMQGFFRNGKEDSIWTKFDKNGNVTHIIKYRNGEILEDTIKIKQLTK